MRGGLAASTWAGSHAGGGGGAGRVHDDAPAVDAWGCPAIRIPPGERREPDAITGTVWGVHAPTVPYYRILPGKSVVPGGPEDVIDCPGQRVDSGVAYLGSSEIGYSRRVRGLRGAGSRSALPLRFSVIFEYGGLIP